MVYTTCRANSLNYCRLDSKRTTSAYYASASSIPAPQDSSPSPDGTETPLDRSMEDLARSVSHSDSSEISSPSSIRSPSASPPLPSSGSPSSLPPVLPLSAYSPMPSQRLYPATPEDISILSSSSTKYPRPIDCEGGVILRLVRLSDPVSSPVGRTVRNRFEGIRGKQRWHFLLYGLGSSLCCIILGKWQLDRSTWKKNIIELRKTRLAMSRVEASSSSPFPWTDRIEEFAYRTVEIRGVLDTSQEVLVGPRPGFSGGNPGYLVVCPLRLQDGSSVLVNRGHCPLKFARKNTELLLERIVDHPTSSSIPGAKERELEKPEWATIRGILEPGEISDTMVGFNFIKRVRNKPQKNSFIFLDPCDLAIAFNHSCKNLYECQQALVSVYDILYDNDIMDVPEVVGLGDPGGGNGDTCSAETTPDGGVSSGAFAKRRPSVFEMRQKRDYLTFWADEYTHFNYAIQWFLLSLTFLGMTAFRFVELTKWKF